MFDFVLKRPPEGRLQAERTTNLYLEQDSQSIGTAYLDAGGRLGHASFFGYRSNLLLGDGIAFVIALGGTVTNGVNSLVNPNQALPPYRSQEWELGFKSAGRPLNLTSTLLRIQRPFANTVPFSATQTISKISGEQVNFGAEISAQGTLFHHLLLDAGFTALNARLYDAGIAATAGKRFVGIPPCEITGTTVSSNSAHLGSPRTISSLQFAF